MTTLHKFLFALLLVAQASAFTPGQFSQPAKIEAQKTNMVDKINKFAVALPVMIASSPLVALAEEADDYEYGAVNAPIGIAWAAGVLAILTALLPIALQGGEEAFEEMKERDSSKWGTGQTDALDSKRKR